LANYDLGSVHGEVRITYDRQGIRDARQDINDYLGDVNRLRDALRQYDQTQQNSSQQTQNFGQRARDSKEAISTLGDALRAISKIPVLAGAAQEMVAFGAAAAPALGIVAAAPAVLGLFAAAAVTVKVGTQGMGDAMSAVAEGDAAKLNEALAKLAPEARNFVLAYRDVRESFKSTQIDVQNALFAGLGDTWRQLGTAYLPVLDRGLIQMAESLNYVGVQSAKALMEPTTVANLGVLLENASLATENFGGALGDVVAGFVNIAAVGSGWLPIWTHGVTDLSARFREWTASAAGQQQINTWIQQGADAIGKLVQIITNVGGIISGVFSAMDTGSGGMLENLVLLTGQMNAWVNSAEGQQTLIPIFHLLHEVTTAILEILVIVVGVVGQVAGAFAALNPETQDVVAQFIAWSAVASAVIGYLTPIIGFITAMAGHIGTLVTVLKALWTAFQFIITVFRIIGTLFMANPWLLLIVAVIALVALIIYNWDTIKAYLLAAWDWIVATAASVWGGLVAFFTSIWDAIKGPVIAVWDFIVGLITFQWTLIWNILRYAAAILLAIFFTIWNPLVDIVTTVWNAIVGFITPILQTIQSAISTAWNAVSAATSAVWNTVVGIITSVWNAIWGVIGPYVKRAWDAIVTAWNAVSSVTSTVWNAITSAISSAWNTITGIFNSAVGTVMGVLSGLWNRISGLASSAMTLLVNAGRNIVQGLWNGIQAMGSWLYNSIMGWVRSVVPGPILQFLGISSPSKYMEKEVGENLPPGIAKGVENETGVAEKASATMARKVGLAAVSQVNNLPINVQQRVGSLAASVGAVSAATPMSSVATAAAPAVAAGGGGRTVNIGTLTVQLQGILDPTDPVAWRSMVERLRTDITNVEASYR
jgi:phage-related protein